MRADLFTLLAFVLGSVVGSFLNVVIYRLPRGESLAYPASHCPSCGAPIRPRHNMPIVGFLMLRGRCHDCNSSISLRYPFVEALMAILSAGLWMKYGFTWSFLVYFVLAAGLVAVSWIDVDHMIIPDSLSLGGIAAGFLGSFLTPTGWRGSLLGAAVGAGILLGVCLAYYAVTRREGMGLGDVKLLGAIGAFLGWQAVLFTVFVSSVAGALVGGAAVGFNLRKAVPFGVFLAFGAIVYLFWGPAIIDWYFNLLS